MIVLVKGFVVAFVLSVISSVGAYAQTTRVVVIPMGGDAVPLQNVITVAKKNGDFTDPVAAMNSIIDADADHRYLLFIGPGVYELASTLVMKEFVDISGSGRNATKLIGEISGYDASSSALVIGADNVEMTSLSLENSGAGGNIFYTVGVYFQGGSMMMSNITITASGALRNYAVYSQGALVLSGVAINASGGSVKNVGIFHNTTHTSARIYNSSISAEGAGAISVDAFNGSGQYETYISNTILKGTVETSFGDPVCSFVFKTDGQAYNEDCEIDL